MTDIILVDFFYHHTLNHFGDELGKKGSKQKFMDVSCSNED